MIQITKDVGRIVLQQHANRWRPPRFLRTAMMLAIFMSSAISAFAVTYEYGPEVVVTECSPASGSKVEKINAITLVFNCDKAINQYPAITESNFVIQATLTSSKTIRLYKGNPDSGELIASVSKGRIIGPAGENKLTFELDKEYSLIDGDLYTVTWDIGIFIVREDGQGAASDVYSEAGSYSFYGASSSFSSFELVSYSPGVNSSVMEDFSLVFSQDVTLASDATARFYEGETLLGETSISVSAENENTVVGKFDQIPLYYTHNYSLSIDEDVIIEKNTDKTFGAVQLDYKGTAYKYFSYGRVTPSNNSEVSYLSTISVPCNGIENGYTLYNVDMPYVRMYEGDATEPMAEIRCTLNTSSSGWEIPVWNFSLKPSTTYRFVLAADQSKLWEPGERTAYVKVEDTSNPELILTYTTPATLEEAPSMTLGESTPSDADTVSFIDQLTVSIDSFDFETVNYLPTLIVENPEAKFMQDGELIKSAPIALEFIQGGGPDGQGVLKMEINETLLKGHNYEVVIPEGIIGPSVGTTMKDEQRESFQNAVKNKERVYSFYGNSSTEATVTYFIGEVGSMATLVKLGETLTVNVAGTEDWKVKELLYNGEEVELEGSEYVTPEITGDATIAVTYEFAKQIDFDYSTGMGDLTDSPYGIVTEGSHVIISGLTGGDNITVYTTGGMMVATLPTVPSDVDKVSISLTQGQVYIILINNTSLKIRL